VELHGLAFLHDIANRNGSGLLIRSDEVPNQEITPLEMTAVLIDHDAQMQRAVRIAALGSSQRIKDVLEALQGRDAAELIYEVLLSPCHDKPFADRTTALRRHGPDSDRSRELHPHNTSVKDLVIEKKSIFS
jgi:Glu-tRNA(Gln) amidotransferase subunit E-like FAD-binding protein